MVQFKSAIFISHRLSSCKFCDRIVVLDHGQIMECGTHSEWMKLQGIDSAMLSTQVQLYQNGSPHRTQAKSFHRKHEKNGVTLSLRRFYLLKTSEIDA